MAHGGRVFNIEKTLLDEVTEAGASDAKLIEIYSRATFQVVAADVTDGATVTIEASLDGTNFTVYHTFTISANGSDMFAISGEQHKWVRANVTSYTDGTYTVHMIAGV